MVDEEAQVRREDTVVWVGENQVGEVGDIVPDVELARYLAPGLDVALELGIGGPGREGFCEVALDGAEPNDNVVPRLNGLGCLAGVLVGEGLDEGVRELLLDLLGDLVHELDQQPSRRFLRLLDSLARLALAAPVPVVLADGDHAGPGVLPEALQGHLHHLSPHLVVGQAELPSLMSPLAVDLRVPLRVSLEVGLRREELVEGVAPADDAVVAAILLGDALEVAVELELRRELTVEGVTVERLTDLERGSVVDVELGHGQRRLLRDEALRRAPPADADDIFEERVDRIQRPARPVAGEEEVIALSLDTDGVGLGVGDVSTDDDPLGALRDFGQGFDGEVGAGDELEVLGEVAGRCLLGGNRVVAQRNDVVGRAVLGEGEVGDGRGGEQGRDGDYERVLQHGTLRDSLC